MRYRLLPALVSAGALCFAQGAYAATHTVDDDKADCPAAAFTSIQAAVDAAAPGDTIAICKGNYVEGSGAPGTNALTITKNLTLKGAGADFVSISPKAAPLVGGRILEAEPDLRNGVGDIVAIVGTPTQPLTVNISGVTVDGYDPAGRAVAVEAGILFLDAKGSVKNSHVTNVVTSEGDNAYTRAGGWRGEQPGIGIAQTSTAMLAPVDGSRRLEIDRTRVDKYNRVGVLIDGAQNDFAPFMAVRHGQLGRHHLQPDHRPHAVRQLRRHRLLQHAGPGHDRPAVRPGRPARHDRLVRDGRQHADLAEPRQRHAARPSRGADDQQRQPEARRGRPLRRREADQLLAARPARHRFADRALEHRRQRLRRDQRRPPTARRRRPADPNVTGSNPPATATCSRPRTTGGACATSARCPSRRRRRSRRREPAGAGEPGQRRGHGRDGRGRRRRPTRSTSSRTAAARSRTRSPARGRS